VVVKELVVPFATIRNKHSLTSANAPEITPQPQTFSVDVLKEALPEIEAIDTLIYCPGSNFETYWSLALTISKTILKLM
jgi:hypothetical protein